MSSMSEPTGFVGVAMTVQQELPDVPSFPHSTVTRNIYCHNSGVVLGRLEICITEGHLAYLQSHNESVYLHPFYNLSSNLLLTKLADAIKSGRESGWVLEWRQRQRLQLLCSALMFKMGCIKQDRSTLPDIKIAVGSAERLLSLATWFFYVDSTKLSFPVYSVNKKNENLRWENYKFWLDAAFEVRQSWSKRSKQLEREVQQRAHDEAVKEIRDDVVYRRLDLKKIWGWIELQLLDNIPNGRINTFKNLFLTGDLEITDWSVDDVDDLREAIVQYCDQGNEITYFIGRRLNGIAALIRDFYSSFTLVTRTSKLFQEEQQTPQEALFFSEFDKKLDAIGELPNPPKREDFMTAGLFARATAQWNILAKRYNARQEQQTLQAKQDATADSPEDTDL